MKHWPPIYRPKPPAPAPPPLHGLHRGADPGLQFKPAVDLRPKVHPTPYVYSAPKPVRILQPKSLANSFRVETRPAPPVFRANQSVVAKSKANQGIAQPNQGTGVLLRSTSAVQPARNITSVSTRPVVKVIQPTSLLSCLGRLCGGGGQGDDVPSSQPLLPTTSTSSSSSVSRSGKRYTVEQGEISPVLKPTDTLDFGLITNCSVVYAANEDGQGVVYHWPLTSWTQDYIQAMTNALKKIGWSSKDHSFSIVVYRQAYKGKAQDFEEDMREFTDRLKFMFTKNVKYVIYPDKHVLTMDGTGKVNL